jgi:transposase
MYLSIKNTEANIIKLAKQIDKYPEKIILESTGRYHLLAAIIFSEYNLDVRVINPLLTKKYITSSIRKIKSDKRDSYILTQIAEKEEKLPSSFQYNRKTVNIRKKLSLISSLEKQLQQMQSTINDYIELKSDLKLTLSNGEKNIINTINELNRLKAKLEQEIEDNVRDLGDNDSSQINRFSSIPGISLYAAALSNFFFSVDYLDSPKQWIAFSGMDVSVNQSGNWRGRCRITKRGNTYLRKRLYQCAWGAIMTNGKFREYYDYLKNDLKRKHTEALVIIARKLIRIMFTLSKNKTMYNPNISLIN